MLLTVHWCHWDSKTDGLPRVNTTRAQRAISHFYWHLVVNNANFTFLLTSCGQEWLFHMSTDIYSSRMAILYCYWHLVVQRMAISLWYWHVVVNNSNSTYLQTSRGPEWEFSDFYWHLVINNGNFILPLTSSGPAWQFLHFYWHLVVNNGNFILLQISSGPEGQISHFYWHLVVNNGNFILLLKSNHLIQKIYRKYQCIENTCRYQRQMDSPPCQSTLPEHRVISWLFIGVMRLKDRWTPQVNTARVQGAISHFYWHLVVNNGNFILLLTSSQLIRKYKEIPVHREHM